MSIAITSMVWQRSKAKGPARLVLLALADHADEEGRAWPSAARLARYTLMDVRNVHRALARLVKGRRDRRRRQGAARCDHLRDQTRWRCIRTYGETARG